MNSAKHRQLIQLVADTKQDMVRANVPFDDTVPFEINNRLKSSLGRCIFNPIVGAIRIEISSVVMNCLDTDKIKGVICHELIHSNRQCFSSGHRGTWKTLANRMNQQNPRYHIAATTQDFTSEQERREAMQRRQKKAQYTIKCQHCDMQQSFTRETKIVRAMKTGHGYLIRCPKCRGTDFKLLEHKK